MDYLRIPKSIGDEIPSALHLNEHKHTLVFFDLHSPRSNTKLVEAAVKYALLNKIPRLILGGDSLDLGFFSSYLNRTGYSPDSTDREMQVSEEMFKAFMTVFEEVIYIPGNHDDRWGTAIQKKVSIDRLLRMILGDDVLDKLITTDRRYLTVDTPAGLWRITHQIGRGRAVPLSTVLQFATNTGQNVASGHEHYLGAVRSRTNGSWAVQGGHMCDENLMEYKQMVDGNYTTWAPGFLEINANGRPILWSEDDIYLELYGEK